ncbi:MAG: 2,3-bisphosphoglycerate-independent phosphoglycerate mutase [Patescibacteria group bacterium]|jgi:2,3-bisphosphoglycerate-independent phosphoglycerate mutase|nr:2,3-bisphosphoglycerate-independent phosphoglycerate mutase [Patescibacteria group bacterium]
METQEKKIPKPVVLIILDGYGVGQPFAGNAISMANTPHMDDYILKYPSMTIRASGDAVGLPWSEEGNSEVGHLNLGLGRIVYQLLPKINRTISDHTFYKNDKLLEAIEHVKKNNSSLHLMGLVSDGGVHASIDHLYALLVLASENNLDKVYIHAFMDGRDTMFNGGKSYIKSVQRAIDEHGLGRIATISGRFYAMDRNNNWDRTEKAYLAITKGIGNKTEDSIELIEKSYKNKIYDEEFVPSVIFENGEPVAKVDDNDAVVFFNYRPDRARQITKAFTLPEFNKFSRGDKIKNLKFATFSEYEKGLPVDVIFPPESFKNCLGEVISSNGLKQLRIAETEKYAHVTYFFNGGIEDSFPGEDHVLVPSPALPSYDAKPEMSAPGITKKVLDAISGEKYDFILINFANADMVGHTANMDAAVEAVEVLDDLVSKIVKATLDKGGVTMITADHGNADVMYDMQAGVKLKEHSSNPVPFLMIGNNFEGKTFGWQDVPGNDLSFVQPQGVLADVAPTVLEFLGIKKPEEMTGESLI